jgi:hypothetical protein
MKKSDLTTGILSQIVISRLIPPRHQNLYYAILSEYRYKELDASEQIIVHNIAWTTCKIIDCQDNRYLFGVRQDIPRDGTVMTTTAERREKQEEVSQLEKLQRQLSNWVSIIRTKKTSINNDQSELERALSNFEDIGLNHETRQSEK